MKTFWLRTELWLPRGRDEIFQFFADPRNLDRLTPSWLQFRILSPTGIAMSKGTLLDYRLRIHGVPIRWQSEISSWNPPDRFVDRQPKDRTRYGCMSIPSRRTTAALWSATTSSTRFRAEPSCKNFWSRPISREFSAIATECYKNCSIRRRSRRANEPAPRFLTATLFPMQ